MRLATFETPRGERHIGALADDAVVDFSAASDAPCMRDMQALIEGGADALAEARALLRRARVAHPLAAVRLLAPVPRPLQMRDFNTFEKHLRQATAQRHLFGVADAERDPARVAVAPLWFEQPSYYKCNRLSVVGPDAPVPRPRGCTMLDYELEFGAFLGRGGRDIAPQDALSHVFGWCIFNDFSARDVQMREMQLGLGPAKGKDFDGGNAMGPWIVTADEIPDPHALTMVARINGEEWSRGSSAGMTHRFDRLISYVSEGETLHAGEFFASGTVGGGSGLEQGRFLVPGDLVELEVQGLGVLRNRVV